MQEALLGSSAPELIGGWRDQQVWIGGTGNSPHSADFVPPHHDHVPALMEDPWSCVDGTRRPHGHAG